MSIHFHQALTSFRSKCNTQKLMHLDFSQIQLNRTQKKDLKDNFIIAL